MPDARRGHRATVSPPGRGGPAGVPVGLAELCQPEATPAGTPWCKTSVAVCWRSGGMTGRRCQGRGSSARRGGGECSSGGRTAAGVALSRNAMGTTVAGPRRSFELAANPVTGSSPRPPTPTGEPVTVSPICRCEALTGRLLRSEDLRQAAHCGGTPALRVRSQRQLGQPVVAGRLLRDYSQHVAVLASVRAAQSDGSHRDTVVLHIGSNDAIAERGPRSLIEQCGRQVVLDDLFVLRSGEA